MILSFSTKRRIPPLSSRLKFFASPADRITVKPCVIVLALVCAAFAEERIVPVSCGSCHIPHRDQGEASVTPTAGHQNALTCLSCHDGQVLSNPHLTGDPIPVRTNLNSPFSKNNTIPKFMSVELSESEKQNCISCHEPHSAHFAEKKSTGLPVYHMSMKDQTRCIRCHKNT